MYVGSQYKEGFEISLYALAELEPLDMLFDDTKSIQQVIDSGKLCVFCAKVTASKNGIELASEYLGQCIYENEEDFLKDQYFKDMTNTVIVEAKQAVKDLQS